MRPARQLKREHAELRKPFAEPSDVAPARMADLRERIRAVEQRETEPREETTRLQRQLVDERDLETAMARFDQVWESMTNHEQIRVLNLLIQRAH